MSIETTQPSRSTLGFNGMVATPHALATATGAAVLRDGGSAMDAAIAANAVLTVVYPDQTSVGGDCFLMYHEATSGKLHALNGSGRAPLAVDRAALRAQHDGRMPGRGIHAVTVPGTVDAWHTAHARFGRHDLADLFAPAIDYARHGFPVSARLSGGIASAADLLRRDPAAAVIYLPNGSAPAPNSRLQLPALADSLTVIARDGRDAFYTGPIAERIAVTSSRLGGALSMVDLAGHRSDWVDPVTSTYHGLTVAEFPPNSQGITALIGLNILEDVDLGSDWGSTHHLHHLIEATKLAYGVRDTHLTDPKFHDIDVPALVSKPFAADLRTRMAPDRVTTGQADTPGDTIAITVIDREGNAASMIQSTYMGFGSGVVADETGIVLQNRGAYFSVDDDHPNRIESGKRTLHTLMPSMLYRADGSLAGAFATQGGDAQALLHIQILTTLANFNHWSNPQAALDRPRWVIAGGESGVDVRVEPGLSESTLSELSLIGHVVHSGGYGEGFGHAQLILRDGETGLLSGASDARADGFAIGC